MQQEKKNLLLDSVPGSSISSFCRALLDISTVLSFPFFLHNLLLILCCWRMHGGRVFAFLPSSFTIHHSLIRPSLFLLGPGFRLLEGRLTMIMTSLLLDHRYRNK